MRSYGLRLYICRCTTGLLLEEPIQGSWGCASFLDVLFRADSEPLLIWKNRASFEPSNLVNQVVLVDFIYSRMQTGSRPIANKPYERHSQRSTDRDIQLEVSGATRIHSMSGQCPRGTRNPSYFGPPWWGG